MRAAAAGAWLAGYGSVGGIDVGLAALVGLLLVAAAAGALAAVVARHSSAPSEGPAALPL